jgi:hypothetical protein
MFNLMLESMFEWPEEIAGAATSAAIRHTVVPGIQDRMERRRRPGHRRPRRARLVRVRHHGHRRVRLFLLRTA